MISAIHIGLSGLQAATKRFNVAANNIVNASTTSRPGEQGFVPFRIVNTPRPGGGLTAEAVPVNPPSIPLFNPDSPNANADGLVNFPNVSLVEEIVQLKMAEHTYKASALIIKTALETERTLLDAFDT
jgi:flagellar basal-body rod protein FlgC